MTTPVRVVRSRMKGSRLTSPNGLPVVCVTRGTKWGNPMPVGLYVGPDGPLTPAQSRLVAVEDYRQQLLAGKLSVTVDDVQRELRGKNLACWCKGSPCHADVLLQVANS